MPLNLKISWGSGASSARLLGLDEGISLAELKGVIASKSGIDVERCVRGEVRFFVFLSRLTKSGRDRRRAIRGCFGAECVATCHARMHAP